MLGDLVRNYFGGFLMGSADIVPGVSGGTVALVIGIYERLVASIKEGSSALGQLLRGHGRGFREAVARVEWRLLLPLLAGILTAVLILASFIEAQLEENPEVLSGAFLGLVAGSVFIAWRLLKSPAALHIVVSLAVGALVFVLLGTGEGSDALSPSLIVFFFSGALAICAMILPGISGSLILVLVGMYGPVLSAVNERDFLAVGVFALGAVFGLALFSQLLNWGLRNHHDVILASLIGLMAGSTRVLWPWPDGVDSAALASPGDDWPSVLLAGVVGLVVVYLISWLANRREATVSV